MTSPIKIRPETRAQLEALKLYRRETIDEVIARLLEREAAGKAAHGAQDEAQRVSA